jgi:hypothetical protein
MLLGLCCCLSKGVAQVVTINPVYTTGSRTSGSATNAGITFTLQNTNAYPMLLTGIDYYINTAGTFAWELWYKSTPLNGNPGDISVANGWTLITSSPSAAYTSGTTPPVLTGINFSIPASTTYRFALVSTSSNISYYGSGSAPNSFTAGGVILGSGDYNNTVGYAGSRTGMSFYPRFFNGVIYLQNAAPCTTPPTAGNATVSTPFICQANSPITLDLSGNSAGSGQTYEWESSTSNAPYVWTSMGAATSSSSLNTTVSANRWFRCKVTCGGQSAYSSIVAVTYNTALPGGTYTIDANGSGTNNFSSFQQFVDILNNCGISGPIVANVAPNTVVNDRVVFNNISGTSATNRIRINGNGIKITNANVASTSVARSTVELNGTKYLTLDSFEIVAAHASYGWGVHLWNDAQFDTLINSKIDLSANTSSSSSYAIGINISNSITSNTTVGSSNSASDCYFGNNHILGSTTSNYGMYYGINVYGSSTYPNPRLSFVGNTIENFYYYGMYIYFGQGDIIKNNRVHRTTKSTVSTTVYGIYLSSSNVGVQIEGNRVYNLHGTNNSFTSTGYGIYVTSIGSSVSSPLNYINNTIYNNKMPLYGIYSTGNTYSNFYHNTIDYSQSHTTTPGTSTVYGIYNSSSSGQYKNNIVNISNVYASTVYGIYSSSVALSNGMQGNVVNVNVPGVTNIPYYYSGTSFTSLAALRTTYPALETTSSSFNPYFANIAIGNLTPTNVLAYRMGVNLSGAVNADINGQARFVANPTPGAFELSSIPSQPGIELNNLIVKDVLCTTTDSLKIIVTNQSSTPLTSFRINWYIDGVAQTPVTYSGNIPGSTTATVFVANYTITPNTVRNLAVKVSLPNNTTNAFNGQDSLATIQGVGMSGTYTINSGAPTSGTNFQNVNDFVNVIKSSGICGPTTVNFVTGSGPYTDPLVLDKIKGLSSVNTLTINGNNNWIEYASTTSNPHLLYMDSVRYVSVKNLNFKSTSTSYGWGAFIGSNCTYDSIQNCIFDLSLVNNTSSTYCNGITICGSNTSPTTSATNTNNIYIGGNKVMGNSSSTSKIYYGITASNTPYVNIVNNTVQDFYYYGLYLSSLTYANISNNDVNKTRSVGANTNATYGIYLINGGTGNKVLNNRVYNLGGVSGTTSTGYGIALATSSGTTAAPFILANNLIYGNKINSTYYGIYSSSSSNVKFLHNTIVLDEQSTSTSAHYGMYFSSTHTNGELKNNLISITAGSIGTTTSTTVGNFGYYFTSATSFTAGNVQRNNVYINLQHAGITYHSYWAAYRANLAAVQAATPAAEVGSLEADPMFIGIPYGNFKPRNISLIVDNGINVATSVPTDIDGVNRSTTPTVGAHEVAPPMPNDAAAISLTNVLCRGTHSISAKIMNNGSNTLNSVQVNWSINGVLQTPVLYTTPIVTQTVSLVNCVHDVVIGNATLNGISTIKVWTSLPNGSTDPNTVNDTFEITDRPALSGVVTINSASPTTGTNYQSFADLTAELDAVGVCGPLTVNVVPNSGPYTEQVELKYYNNVSAVNTITINGNGNVLQYNNVSVNYTILRLFGAKYVKVNDLVIKTLGTTYGMPIAIGGGASMDSITNCKLDMTSITGSSNTYGISFTNSLTGITSAVGLANNIYIGNNVIEGLASNMYGPYYGMYLSTGADSLYIHKNEFKNIGYYGVYVGASIYNTVFDGNEFHRSTKTSTTSHYSMYLSSYTMPGLKIINNRFHTPYNNASSTTSTWFPIYTLADGTTTTPIEIYNNQFYNMNMAVTTSGAMYFSGALYNKVYHNTISFDRLVSTSSTQYGVYFTGTNTGTEFKNNIINFDGAYTTSAKYGYYVGTATGIAPADFQRNNVFIAPSITSTSYYCYMGAARANVAALQTAYPTMEVGSTMLNPYFGNSIAGDLKPTILGSGLYAAGLNLTATTPTDIFDVVRPTNPTPGSVQMDRILAINAGADTLNSPLAFCAGSSPIVVTIKNEGLNNITSMQIFWSVNGVNQPTYNFTGNLTSPLTNVATSKALITLGNANLINGVNEIKWWTYRPNNQTDSFNNNDTAVAIIRSGLFGNYTINQNAAASATNYTSISAFVNDLNTTGICGPVTATIATGSGPYVEQVEVLNVTGASSTNTITLDGNGEAMHFTPTSTSNMRLFVMNGTKFMTVRNLTLKSNSATYGWGFHIYNGAMNDSVINCHIDLSMATTSTSSYISGLAISNSATSPTSAGTTASNIYVKGNLFSLGSPTSAYGAYYGICAYGSASAATTISNIHLIDNEIKNFYYYGIYFYGVRNPVIKGNNIHKSEKTTIASAAYGVYASACIAGNYSNNRIHSFSAPNVAYTSSSSGYPMYLISENTYENTNPSYVINNAIYNLWTYNSTFYGIYTTGNNLRFMHNTVDLSYNHATSSTSTQYGIYFSGSSNNSYMINNNITITGGNTGGAKYGLYTASTASYVANTGLNGNNIYVNTPNSTGANYYSYYGGIRNTLADFRAAYPAFEALGKSVDPMYFNRLNAQFHPTNNVIVRAGENQYANVPFDIENSTRIFGSTPGAFEEYRVNGIDGKMLEIIDPISTICPGVSPIKVALMNNGRIQLSNFNINWSYGGVTQTPYVYTSTLDTMGGVGRFIDTVLISNFNFPVGANELKVWLSLANDSVRLNDTASKTINPAQLSILVSRDTTCYNGTVTVSASGITGVNNFTWYRSQNGGAYNVMTGVTTSPISLTNIQSRQGVYAGFTYNNITCYSDTAYIDVIEPRLIAHNDTFTCYNTVATLHATATNATDIYWFDNMTSTTPLATGNVFTTPILTNTRAFYPAAIYIDSNDPNFICIGDRETSTVTVTDYPQIDLGNDTSYCVQPGHIAYLNARNPGADYLWDNNYNGQVRTVTASGTYSVTVTNSHGCQNSDTITIVFKPSPVVDLGNDTFICSNSGITLDAGPDGISYMWSTGEATREITTRTAGTFKVNVIGNNGCATSDSMTITYGTNAPAVDRIWTRAITPGTFKFSAINPQNVTSYVWDFGDGSPLSFVNEPTHTYNADGNYVVRLTLYNDCGSVIDTAVVHILKHFTNIDNLSDGLDVSLYPNPTNGTVKLNVADGVEINEIQIFNLLGQQVYNQVIENGKVNDLSLERLGAATYNVRIITDKGVVTRKLDIIK